MGWVMRVFLPVSGQQVDVKGNSNDNDVADAHLQLRRDSRVK